MPEVTVLTAVRNGAAHIEQTIKSIQQQTLSDWEYIIVDDSSTDNTTDLIEAIMKQDSRIKLLNRATPGGPYLAAIEAIPHISGRYVARIDGDDIALPNRLQIQIQFLKDNPRLRATASYAQRLDQSGPIRGDYVIPPLSSGTLKWMLWLRVALVHSTAFVERETFINSYVGSPLASKYKLFSQLTPPVIPDVEDYRMWTKLTRLGVLEVVPEVLVYWRRHNNRVSTVRQKEQRNLALTVITEHVYAMSGITLSEDDAFTLYAVGHSEAWPITSGLNMLRQWDRLWNADGCLSSSDIQELSAISAFRRRKFLRHNARCQKLPFLLHARSYLLPKPARTR